MVEFATGDLATLGLKVDSRDLERANRGLDTFSRQRAPAAERATDRMRRKFERGERQLRSFQRVLGFAGITVGIAAVARGIEAVVDQISEAERQQRRLEQLVESTGGTAGLTADQINRISREIGIATLASTENVRQAAGQLLTFRSISEPIFRRTLEAAQDLAEVGFGSLESATVQLGKALEDPLRGLSQLRRVGVSFSAEQETLIKRLVETNELLKAQEIVLKAVEGQVGGAGAAGASGLTGAVDSLTENWNRLIESLGKTQNIQAATGFLADLTRQAADFLETLAKINERDPRFFFEGGKQALEQGSTSFNLRLRRGSGGPFDLRLLSEEELNDERRRTLAILGDMLDMEESNRLAAKRLGEEQQRQLQATTKDTEALRKESEALRKVLRENTLFDAFGEDFDAAVGVFRRSQRQDEDKAIDKAKKDQERADQVRERALEREAARFDRFFEPPASGFESDMAALSTIIADQNRLQDEAIGRANTLIAAREREVEVIRVLATEGQAAADVKRDELTINTLFADALPEQRQRLLDLARASREYQKAAELNAQFTRETAEAMRLSVRPAERLQKELERLNELARRFPDVLPADVVADLERKTKRAILGTDELARDLSTTLARGFEDAIVRGEDFRGVLRGIEEDILRILTRVLITKPFENALLDIFGDIKLSGGGTRGGFDLSNIFGGIGNIFGGSSGGVPGFDASGPAVGGFFGGAFAHGGRPPLGVPSIVGERGRELFIPDMPGTIVDHGTTERALRDMDMLERFSRSAPLIIDRPAPGQLADRSSPGLRPETEAAINRLVKELEMERLSGRNRVQNVRVVSTTSNSFDRGDVDRVRPSQASTLRAASRALRDAGRVG